jgi:polycomb group RING finger protein 4
MVFLGSDALSNLKPSILKQLYGAVVGYILECAKRNTDPLEMTYATFATFIFLMTHYLCSEFLQGPTVQLPPARVEIITAKYTEVKPAVRSGLAGNGYNLPHLVDVDWRLDYFVKADTIDRATKPLYLLRLKARTDNLAEYPNGHKTIEFTATLEQLQDMVNKLADATQSLNRLDLS